MLLTVRLNRQNSSTSVVSPIQAGSKNVLSERNCLTKPTLYSSHCPLERCYLTSRDELASDELYIDVVSEDVIVETSSSDSADNCTETPSMLEDAEQMASAAATLLAMAKRGNEQKLRQNNTKPPTELAPKLTINVSRSDTDIKTDVLLVEQKQEQENVVKAEKSCITQTETTQSTTSSIVQPSLIGKPMVSSWQPLQITMQSIVKKPQLLVQNHAYKPDNELLNFQKECHIFALDSKGNHLHKCALCSKVFTVFPAFQSHVQTHYKFKNKCDVCGKLFSRSWLLKGHMRTHTGERPYQCDFPGCTKAFADKSNLRSHNQIHSTKGKNFVCAKCNRGFAQKRYLHKHLLEVCKV